MNKASVFTLLECTVFWIIEKFPGIYSTGNSDRRNITCFGSTEEKHRIQSGLGAFRPSNCPVNFSFVQ